MKLKSMTGFGRAEVSNDQYRLSVEVKSVNSRFLDLSIKMPKKFNALEANIRNTVKEWQGRSLHHLRELFREGKGPPARSAAREGVPGVHAYTGERAGSRGQC